MASVRQGTPKGEKESRHRQRRGVGGETNSKSKVYFFFAKHSFKIKKRACDIWYFNYISLRKANVYSNSVSLIFDDLEAGKIL